jgi:hypothetical protein
MLHRGKWNLSLSIILSHKGRGDGKGMDFRSRCICIAGCKGMKQGKGEGWLAMTIRLTMNELKKKLQ